MLSVVADDVFSIGKVDHSIFVDVKPTNRKGADSFPSSAVSFYGVKTADSSHISLKRVGLKS